MANKRVLKKAINNVADDVLTDCMFCMLLSTAESASKAETLTERILNNRAEALSKVRAYPRSSSKETKAYFNQLIQLFSTEADEVMNEAINLMKPEV